MKRSKRSKISAKSVILILALVCVICLVAVAFITCNKQTITSQEAFDIVLNDLGITAEQTGSPHIHEGTYENQPCYNIYVTANGKSLTYVVSTTGEILHKGEGTHSH